MTVNNFNLEQIPERTVRPRTYGLTRSKDKGFDSKKGRNLVSGAYPYIDMVKLAFGTSFVTPDLHDKIKIYQSAGVPVYFGGLLFEAFIIRNQFADYVRLLEEYAIPYIEVSDGSIDISHEEKCGYIEKLSKYGVVLSEVGSKDKDREHITPPYQWIQLMKSELEAGASYIIAEARHTATVALHPNSAPVREGLVQEILTERPARQIVW